MKAVIITVEPDLAFFVDTVKQQHDAFSTILLRQGKGSTIPSDAAGCISGAAGIGSGKWHCNRPVMWKLDSCPASIIIVFFPGIRLFAIVKFPGMMEINCLGIHRFITSCFYHDISIFIRSYGFYYKEFI